MIHHHKECVQKLPEENIEIYIWDSAQEAPIVDGDGAYSSRIGLAP